MLLWGLPVSGGAVALTGEEGRPKSSKTFSDRHGSFPTPGENRTIFSQLVMLEPRNAH